MLKATSNWPLLQRLRQLCVISLLAIPQHCGNEIPISVSPNRVCDLDPATGKPYWFRIQWHPKDTSKTIRDAKVLNAGQRALCGEGPKT